MHVPVLRKQETAVFAAMLVVLGGSVGCDPHEGSELVVQTGRAGAAGMQESLPWFRDVTAESGVAFEHVSGAQGEFLFPEIMGGGAALADFDDDGHVDLYLVQSGFLTREASLRPGNVLYRNRGDGTFEDVTAGSGADDRGYGMGAATGDFNHNGLIDLYVTNVGPNVLLRNDGSMRFTDVSRDAGVDDAGWGTSAAFVDIDQDGWLDLFVVNYIIWTPEQELSCVQGSGIRDYCAPNSYGAPAPDVYYRNRGDGTFEDLSVAAGLRSAFGNGLGVVCADFDGDGWIDVFVANDQNENQLWQNQDGVSLRDVAARVGVAVDRHGEPKAGMGTHAVDYFDNARPDLLIVNLRNQSDSFHRNEGRYFDDDTSAIGLGTVTRPYTRFGVAMHDFDHDGHLDYFVANGRVVTSSDLPMHLDFDPYAEPNILLRGTANRRLAEVLPRGGTDPVLYATSRAAAFGDIDGDGAIDVVVVNRDAPAHVLRNEAGSGGNWILFRVIDRSGRDALHATLEIELEDGTVRVRDSRTAYSYLAANDPRVHLGLGRAERVRGVTVRWPGGTAESFGAFPANGVAVLREGEGTGAAATLARSE